MNPVSPTRQSLRRVVRIFIASLLALFILLLVVVIMFRGRTTEEFFWQERLNETAANASVSIASHIENAFNALRSLARLYNELEGSGTHEEAEAEDEAHQFIQAAMQAMVDSHPALDEIVVTHKPGTIELSVIAPRMTSAPMFSDPTRFWQEEWPFNVSTEQRWISDLKLTADGDPYILIGISQPDQTLVAARVNMQTLEDTIGAIDIGRTGDAFIAERTGQVIVHFEGDEGQEFLTITGTPSVAGNPALKPEVTSPGASWSGNFINFANEAVFASAVAIPGTEWVLFVEVSQNERTAFSQTSLALFGIIISVVFAALFFIMNRVLGRLIFTPLDNLYQSARQTDAHHLMQPLPILRQDEIGSVTQAYNEMLLRLREQTDALRTARDEALEHDRLKSQFLSTMSHELRTPLNAIDGYASLMLMTGLSGESGEWAERIRVNSRILLNQINDVLEFSRLDAGRTIIRYKARQVSDMVSQWKSLISPLAADHKLEFRVELDPDLPTQVETDDIALTRIVGNLLGNAVKFTKEGHIGLRLAPDGDDHWLIEVSDSGIGIPPEAQGYIFEDFRQVDESTTRTYGGSGLGLAIVRRILELMGGTITLQSEVGKGSTFTVRLPLKPAPV